MPLRRRHSWTREQLLAAIRQWAAEHGGDPPRYADFRAALDRVRWPDPKTVATAFGGWRAAQNAAGFGVQPTRRETADEPSESDPLTQAPPAQ